MPLPEAEPTIVRAVFAPLAGTEPRRWLLMYLPVPGRNPLPRVYRCRVLLDLSSDAGPHRYSRNPKLTSSAERTLRRSATALCPGIDVKPCLRNRTYEKLRRRRFPGNSAALSADAITWLLASGFISIGSLPNPHSHEK